MKGTKEITVCDTPNCGEEATGECESCGKDMCSSHTRRVCKHPFYTMSACTSCLAPILGQRVETKGVAK